MVSAPWSFLVKEIPVITFTFKTHQLRNRTTMSSIECIEENILDLCGVLQEHDYDVKWNIFLL
jgi:hypothetical protein